MAVLVGKQAPDFSADAVVNGDFRDNFRLSDYRGRYVLMFFYPLDFTFVCPTELHAFQERLGLFQQLNTEVIGISIDSKFSHHAWLNTPKSQGGIQGVVYPLVSDIKKEIAKDYDVLVSDAGVALRGTFLIDKEGIVRHQVVNDLSLGRNVDEAIRMVHALQHHEQHGEVCPADWQRGNKSFPPNQEGLKDYFS